MNIYFLCLQSFCCHEWIVNVIKCCFLVSSVNTIQVFEFGVEPSSSSQSKPRIPVVFSSFLHARVYSVHTSCLDFLSVLSLERWFLLYFLKACSVVEQGCAYVCVPEERVRSPGAEVTGGHELLNVGAKTQTQEGQ